MRKNASEMFEKMIMEQQKKVNWQPISLEDVPEANRPETFRSCGDGERWFLLSEILQNEVGQTVAIYTPPIDGMVRGVSMKPANPKE